MFLSNKVNEVNGAALCCPLLWFEIFSPMMSQGLGTLFSQSDGSQNQSAASLGSDLVPDLQDLRRIPLNTREKLHNICSLVGAPQATPTR